MKLTPAVVAQRDLPEEEQTCRRVVVTILEATISLARKNQKNHTEFVARSAIDCYYALRILTAAGYTATAGGLKIEILW